MKARVVWTRTVWVLFQELPDEVQDELLEKVQYLEPFPHLYPVIIKSRRFRRHRWFRAGNWLLFYRVADNTVYIRGLWPARIP
ncbi:MAG: hypothetical protein LAN61_03490 [Acidobacteriia bacterium]|nr:hypothetical protein [Terriglobia bacterium]